jgi:Tfp pilus assembly protein PilZ
MDIVKVRFRTNDEFDAAYQADLELGGLFCPTTSPLEEGQKVVIELSAPALPNKVLIKAEVRSWRPALPRLRVRAGAVVEFDPSESEKRDFIIETIRGERAPSPKRRHSRLPVAIPVRYRISDSVEFVESTLSEISIGGCTLATDTPIPIDSDVIVEITPPGAVSAISISGKATYHRPDGGTGIKFVYRDGGGSRRLRELVRRLKQS